MRKQLNYTPVVLECTLTVYPHQRVTSEHCLTRVLPDKPTTYPGA